MPEERKRRTLEEIHGVEKASEIRQKLTAARIGKVSPLKGMSYEERFGPERAQEWRRKLSEGHMGHRSPFVGKTLEEIHGAERAAELRRVNSEQNTGRVRTEETRQKISSALKGHSFSGETKEKISKANRGRHRQSPVSEETRQKLREALLGRPSPARGKRISEAYGHKRSGKWNDWREMVFERDKFTCQHCGSKEQSKLRPHHIIPWSESVELRFDVANGLTLCVSCHSRVTIKSMWEREKAGGIW